MLQPTSQGTMYSVVRSAASKLGLQEGRDLRSGCAPGLSRGPAGAWLFFACSGPCPRQPRSAPPPYPAWAITITSEREAAHQVLLPLLQELSQHTGAGQPRVRQRLGLHPPFSWDLWLALLGTLLIVPPYHLHDRIPQPRIRIHRGDVVPGVLESGWRSAITLMLMDGFAVTSQGARIAVLCFCFLALLVTSTYTANLAAFVTVSTIRSRIESIGDLRGRAVGTSPIYIDRLQKYGIQGIPYPLHNGSDYLVWRDLVATGQLAALVRDTPALQWLANTAPLCNVAVLPEQIEPFDYGIAFHVNTSEAVVDAWSGAILKLQASGERLGRGAPLVGLFPAGIVNPSTGCQESTQVSKSAQAVSFSDLYGLWIIPAAGLALGGSTMLAQRCLRRRRKQGGLSRQSSAGDLPLATGGPLPNERQPLRLLASTISLKRLRSGRLRGGSLKGRQQPGQQPGGGATVAAVKDASVGATSACCDTFCDLDSEPSFSKSGEAPPAPSAAAGTPHGPATRQQARQAASRLSDGTADEEGQMRQQSSLQDAASIYTGIPWKSPRSSSHAGLR
ncbi:hypothetical protein ABPG77_010242 [Micractinium sp. CCAP 211/92]